MIKEIIPVLLERIKEKEGEQDHKPYPVKIVQLQDNLTGVFKLVAKNSK